MNFDALKLLGRKQTVSSLLIIEHQDRVCAGCLVGIHNRNPFPTMLQFRKKQQIQVDQTERDEIRSNQVESEKTKQIIATEVERSSVLSYDREV